MLPDALRRPTPFGQTLGDLRLLVLGSQGAGKSFLTGLLLEDNEDVVEVGTWEDAEYGKVLRASTDWLEHRDAHGLEKYEATRNVEIVELPGYDHNTDGNELVAKLKSIIHSPFYAVSDVLHPTNQPSAILANLLSSPCTPLYTALIFLMPSSPTTLDRLIINSLGPHVPIIVLPSLHPNRDRGISKLSSFRPPSAVALRVGLFHSPETVALLRSEATDRFLRWREVERAADDVHASRRHTGKNTARHNSKWDKSRWESEWMETLSLDVAKRVREGTITERDIIRTKEKESHPPCINSPFDPLHLPSLFMFSVSLLGPLRSHMRRTLSDFFDALGELNVKLALVGGFLVGMGIGVYAR
ncbi:hypothetical protein BDQ12DRAFT_618299 [Crucibulum laeve]|uniref:Septin-type G domain-containing protein n=1 Tax=Crucibulum laeve TaxID=68775 RepID=A0A5C3LIR3_9AGAR|nr:hypothetical protein BDQ12DRAFT_618299 [Crucibulum laeve]